MIACADIENKQSLRVMEKLVMRQEAPLRSDMPSAVHTDERSDTVWYGVLREEWAISRGGKWIGRRSLE